MSHNKHKKKKTEVCDHVKVPATSLHRDWRTWGVLLMLAAMVIYVLTMDESLQPVAPMESLPVDAGGSGE